MLIECLFSRTNSDAPIPTHQFGSRDMYHSTHYFVTRLGQSIKDYEDFKTKILGDSQ